MSHRFVQDEEPVELLDKDGKKITVPTKKTKPKKKGSLRQILAEEAFHREGRQETRDVQQTYLNMVQLFFRLRFAFPEVREDLRQLEEVFERLLGPRVERYMRDQKGIFRMAGILKIRVEDAYDLLNRGFTELGEVFPEVVGNLRQIHTKLESLVGERVRGRA